MEPRNPRSRETAPDPHTMMRTTVFFPASLLAGVRVIAVRKGTTSAAIIRSAVELAVGGRRPPPQGGFL